MFHYLLVQWLVDIACSHKNTKETDWVFIVLSLSSILQTWTVVQSKKWKDLTHSESITFLLKAKRGFLHTITRKCRIFSSFRKLFFDFGLNFSSVREHPGRSVEGLLTAAALRHVPYLRAGRYLRGRARRNDHAGQPVYQEWTVWRRCAVRVRSE